MNDKVVANNFHTFCNAKNWIIARDFGFTDGINTRHGVMMGPYKKWMLEDEGILSQN